MQRHALESAEGRIAGVDEVGRGPLAGPVLAAAVVLPARLPRGLAPLLDDSKALTRAQREQAFAQLRRHHAVGTIEIGIGAASVLEIDRINILQATLQAMRRAVAALPRAPDLALVDGNQPPPLACQVRCVVGGDALCRAIAAASIVAKVVRDRAMQRLDRRFPPYGWADNAGYATRLHRAALRTHGPTPHHRAAFGTVRLMAMQAGWPEHDGPETLD